MLINITDGQCIQKKSTPGVYKYTTEGFTLLEVLIALAVFSIAALGLTGLQIRSMSTAQDLTQRSTVTRVLQDFASRVRGNSSAINNYRGEYTAALCNTTPAVFCADQNTGIAALCTPTQMANYDNWASLCGDSGESGMQRSVIDWTVNVSCINGPADCASQSSQVQVTASWARRKGDTDIRLAENFVNVDVMGNGVITNMATTTDQMVLVFSPW